jgi:predicted RNase H-like nuclease (RuvC/YqgF family)
MKGYHGLNNHERDALAAALKAYNFFSHKLRQIKKQEGRGFESNVRGRLRIRKGKRI